MGPGQSGVSEDLDFATLAKVAREQFGIRGMSDRDAVWSAMTLGAKAYQAQKRSQQFQQRGFGRRPPQRAPWDDELDCLM